MFRPIHQAHTNSITSALPPPYKHSDQPAPRLSDARKLKIAGNILVDYRNKHKRKTQKLGTVGAGLLGIGGLGVGILGTTFLVPLAVPLLGGATALVFAASAHRRAHAAKKIHYEIMKEAQTNDGDPTQKVFYKHNKKNKTSTKHSGAITGALTVGSLVCPSIIPAALLSGANTYVAGDLKSKMNKLSEKVQGAYDKEENKIKETHYKAEIRDNAIARVLLENAFNRIKLEQDE